MYSNQEKINKKEHIYKAYWIQVNSKWLVRIMYYVKVKIFYAT